MPNVDDKTNGAPRAFHDAHFSKLAFAGSEHAMDELLRAFQLGADPSTLDVTQARIVDDVMAQVGAARSRPVQRISPTLSRLDVRGTCREDGGSALSLSRSEQQVFSHYGTLPAHRLECLNATRLEDLESAVDRIVACGMSSSLAYLFSKEILDLALSPEIVERVASLLGDDLTLTATSGPMYLPPLNDFSTQWHAANGRAFGAERSDRNLSLVTVWVSLNGATRESGCMKMIPGSFDFVEATRPAIEYRPPLGLQQQLPPELHCIVGAIGRALEGSVPSDWIRKVLVRTLNAPQTPGMWFKDQGRMNPFHIAVNEFFAIDKQLDPALQCIALEARPGDCYVFSSQNLHASFRNQTSRWRKAIAFRYMTTGDVFGANLADGHERIAEYRQAFSRSSMAWWKALDLDRKYYLAVSPRICVKGALPAKRAALYVDLDTLRQGLEADNGHWERVYARRGLAHLDNPKALRDRSSVTTDR